MAELNWQQREERKRRKIQRGRDRVLGIIAIIWGADVLIYSLLQGGPQGEGAYLSGQMAGWVFGVLMVVVGLYFVLRKSGGSKAKPVARADDTPLHGE